MNEDQEYEILALESIRPEEFTRTPIGFIVDIEAQVTEGTLFTLVTNTKTKATLRARLEFLPPIRLSITLTTEYPESQPPVYELTCPWLTTERIGILKERMSSLYDENGPGSVIVFEWTDFLRTETLPIISETTPGGLPLVTLHGLPSYGYKAFVPLTASGPANTDDNDSSLASSVHLLENALQTCGLNSDASEATEETPSSHATQAVAAIQAEREVFFRALLTYDDLCKQRRFQADHHPCAICLEDKAGTVFFQQHIYCEHHQFCKSCLAGHAKTIIRDGDMARLICPQPKCDQQLMPDLIKKLVDPEEYERYEKMTLEISLSEMSDVSSCPRCEATVVAEDTFANCPQCDFYYCTTCRLSWHGDRPCESVRSRLSKVSERTGFTMADLEDDAAIDHLSPADQEIINELKTCLALRSLSNGLNIKACPVCRINIQKSGGCNKMTCNRCGTKFCWLCHEVIFDYDHFWDGGCVLFQEGDLADGADDIHNPANAEDIAHLVKGCPNCGNLNAKHNDHNRLVCRQCRFHYCFLCLEPCFGNFHFDEDYGCKMYTTEGEDREHPYGVNYDGEAPAEATVD